MADPTFTKDIKPLFRKKDREAMLRHFDLWSVQDVRSHSTAIVGIIRAGRMPCDGRWSPEDVDLLGRWIAGGMPE